jgi:glycosyltransferase involved in cell wall biosynthesis
MKVLLVHNFYRSQYIGGEDLMFQRELAALTAQLGQAQIWQYTVDNDQLKLGKLLKNIWGDRQHAHNIKTMVQTHQIDLVHVHNFFPLLTPLVFKAAQQAGAKVVHTLHNFRWWCLPGVLFRNNQPCERCVTQRLPWWGIFYRCYRNSWLQSTLAALAWWHYKRQHYSHYIDYYFALSQFQRDKLSSLNIAQHKILLKPNALAESTLLYPIAAKQDYIYVGRLEPSKGIEALCALWQKLAPHYVLKIVGSGVQQAQLMAQYAQSNIQFLGAQPPQAVTRLLAKAKYLIHPGLAYETFGLVMLEAMQQGTPVIGFPIGTRNDFIQSGHNGFLTSWTELPGLIARIDQYPDYVHLSKAARAFAKQFGLKRVTQQQIQLYQRILGAPLEST